MILTCPKCGGLNDNKTIIIISDDLYRCYSCSYQFTQSESLDRDWDKLHESFKKDISPEICLDWRTNNLWEYTKKLEKEFGRYGLESAFYQHFGVRYNEVDNNELNRIKINLERDKKLNKLL